MAEPSGATALLGAFVAGCTTAAMPRGVSETAAIRLLDAEPQRERGLGQG